MSSKKAEIPVGWVKARGWRGVWVLLRLSSLCAAWLCTTTLATGGRLDVVLMWEAACVLGKNESCLGCSCYYALDILMIVDGWGW